MAMADTVGSSRVPMHRIWRGRGSTFKKHVSLYVAIERETERERDNEIDR